MKIEELGPEIYNEVPVNALEVMERDRQAHRAQELFDDLIGKGYRKQAEKVARFMETTFNIQLSSD